MIPKIVLFTAMIFFFCLEYGLSETGYRKTPWGSKQWRGPGPPPHWSNQEPRPGRPVDPGWGVRPPVHRPGRLEKIYIFRRPETETIVIQQPRPTRQVPPAYHPVQKPVSPLRCSGRTITRKDPRTGEMIIDDISCTCVS